MRFHWLYSEMEAIFEALQARAERSRDGAAQPRIGIVTSYDYHTATARVLLQPEGVLTGWLPVLTPWAGSGWGMTCPIGPGDQVLIIFQEGDVGHGIILGCLYSNTARPPGIGQEEFVLKHRSGSSIRLLNSGTIMIEGDLRVSGDIYDTHGSLSKLRNDYNIHIHRVSNGTITSTPIPVD